MGGAGNACKFLVWISEGTRLLGRPTCTWEDNITMDIKETVHKDVEWIHQAEERVLWTC